MDKLYTVLEALCPGVDFKGSKTLVDDGELESLDIVMIISELMELYEITIPMEEISPENFNSVEAMHALAMRLGG